MSWEVQSSWPKELVIWNNKDVRINSKPGFYKMSFNKGILYMNDLQFNVDNVRSYESF